MKKVKATAIKKQKYGKPMKAPAGLRAVMPASKGKTKAPFGKIQKVKTIKLKG